jgi:hypothetical protein
MILVAIQLFLSKGVHREMATSALGVALKAIQRQIAHASCVGGFYAETAFIDKSKNPIDISSISVAEVRGMGLLSLR